MKKTDIIKYILDLAMVILFITFFNKDFINMKFHMSGGILFGVFIIIHMIINRKWIKAISKRFFNKNLKMKTRISYIVSFLLLISILLILISGFKIILAPVSKKVFWKMIHYGFSYISLGLIAIHMGICWNKIKNMLKKY